jgi:2-polyprenyl-3-methyl-5-hydroxy-6-metoxy-1,4-benzoquinol methylase
MIKRFVLSALRRRGYRVVRAPRDHYRVRIDQAEFARLRAEVLQTNGARDAWRNYVTPRRMAFYHEVAALLDRLGLSLDGKRILDVGAFFGLQLHALHARWPHGKYHGIECAPAVLPVGQKICPFAEIKLGTIDDLTELFDVIICMEVFEHLVDPERALHRLVGATRECLLVTVPDGRYDTTPAGTCRPERNSYDGHVNFWSRESWQAWLTQKRPAEEIQTGIMPTGQLWATVLTARRGRTSAAEKTITDGGIKHADRPL